MLAFLSYARDDWADPSSATALTQIVETLQSRVRSAMGEKAFEIWRDVERIRWSARWRDELAGVIARCDVFIVLMSPLWVKSDVCRQEYHAFLDREEELGGAARIFSAKVVAVDPARFSEADGRVLTALDARQFRDWTALVDMPEADRNREIRAAGAEMAEALHALGAAAPPPPQKAVAVAAAVPVPVDAQEGVLPLVSGCYLVPKGQRPQDAETHQVLLSLAFAGRARVATVAGSIVFATRAATVMNRLSCDGVIVNARPEFEQGWKGPSAIVRAAAAGLKTKGYWVEASDEGGLRGNPLAGPADGSHVPLLEVRCTEALKLSGFVSVEVEAVEIDGPACDPPQEAEALASQRRALARLVLERCGGARFPIEEDAE